MQENLVTLIVVPRERFSQSIASLTSIYENTSYPFSLVYVDGNSPTPVRRQLDREAVRRGFELIRTDEFVTPTQARNIGYPRVTTKYVVFIDNDVFVVPGWLERLVTCAEESGAAAVGPIYLQGPPEEKHIHMAGGEAHIVEEDGKRICVVDDHFEHEHLDDVKDRIPRGPTELLEFHALLVRREVLDELGGLDEGFLNTREHIDLCMSLRKAGHEIWLEPESQVSYLRPPPFKLYDLRFFMMRWGEEWTRATLEHYHRKWSLEMDETDRTMSWTKKQRYRFLDPYMSRIFGVLFKVFGRDRTRHTIQRLLFPIEGLVNRFFVRDPQRRSANIDS